jgi:beta-glucanase (GH16 family)
LVWSDEFDKDGLPDPAKWSFEDRRPGWVNNESQNYPGARLENARVSNGFLIIEARKDGFNGHDYSSARIHTAGKGEILYGRVEVRAKLPSGRGTWPAIWMMPADYYGYGEGWPDSGEIDIMEQVGKDPNWVHASIHCRNYYHVKGNQKTARIFDSTLSSGFHVYAIEWKKGQIDVYMDDMKFFTARDPGEGWEGWPFDKKFYLILNLAIGGVWGGAIDDSIFPQRMTVDYVRMYRAPVRR